MRQFSIGDKLKVIVDEPECSGLKKGDIVDVIGYVQHDERYIDNYFVSFEGGAGWMVHGKYMSKHGEKTIIHNGLTYDLREPQPVEWQWGMWADYEGKRVFVMSGVDDDGQVQISHPDFNCRYDYADEFALTPILD